MVGVILSIIILLASFIFLFIVPQVRLKGKRVMVINYKEKYVEPGYRAYFLNKKLTNKVVVTGGVNSSKLGTYKIKYSMGYKGFNFIFISNISFNRSFITITITYFI